MFGKKRNNGNFLVGPMHFLSWPTKNSSLWIREKTRVKTLVPTKWQNCPQILILLENLTYTPGSTHFPHTVVSTILLCLPLFGFFVSPLHFLNGNLSFFFFFVFFTLYFPEFFSAQFFFPPATCLYIYIR